LSPHTRALGAASHSAMSASMSRAVMLLASAALANGVLLRMDSPLLRGKAAAAPSGSNTVDKLHQVAASPGSKVAPSATKDAKTEASEGDQLKKLQTGLKAIQNLRAQFSHETDNAEGSKFAYGALSLELSKNDSSIWSTLTDMLDTTAQAMKQMKSKGKNEKKDLMADLEKTLDSKAGHIMNMTNEASKAQQSQDEEYLLGLLNMHSTWSMEQQLNATSTFKTYSPVIAQLYNHHDASKPLAPQLANLMDEEKATKNKVKIAMIQLQSLLQVDSHA